jgi:hypothetical protein
MKGERENRARTRMIHNRVLGLYFHLESEVQPLFFHDSFYDSLVKNAWRSYRYALRRSLFSWQGF